MIRAAVLLASLALCSLCFASGPPRPAGFGEKPKAPAANGEGRVTFKHGAAAVALPLNHIEIEAKEGITLVSLVYLDAAPDNRFELYFGFDGIPGKVDQRQITGLRAETKAAGTSKSSFKRSNCTLTVTEISATAVVGELACTGLTLMDGATAAPDLKDVAFTAKMK